MKCFILFQLLHCLSLSKDKDRHYYNQKMKNHQRIQHKFISFLVGKKFSFVT